MAARAETTIDRDQWGVSLDSILAAQRRYLEGWAGASRIMADAMRSVVQRQVEFAESEMRAFWSEHDAALREGPSRSGEPIERLCSFYERAFASFQEMSDIVLKAQSEAMQVFSDCAVASLEDMKKAA